MSDVLTRVEQLPVLSQARGLARTPHRRYAGSPPPCGAWTQVRAGQAALIDLRTLEQRKNVFNVQEGFGGGCHQARQRGATAAWRFRGLPGTQE